MPSPAEQIHYVVLHATIGAHETSPFQAYGIGLLEASYVLSRIARLPFDIRDFGRTWDQILERRMQGDGCSVTPLQIDALEKFLSFGFPFVCVCTPAKLVETAVQIIRAAMRLIHHVHLPAVELEAQVVLMGSTLRLVENTAYTAATCGEGALPGLTYHALLEYALTTIAHLEKIGPPYSPAACPTV